MSPTKEEGFLQIARKALPLVLRVSPGLFVFEYAVTVLDALLLVLTTVALRGLFEHVAGLAAGSVSFDSALMALLLFALLKAADEAIDGVANFTGEYYAGKSSQAMMNELNLKADRLDALKFEDPEILSQMDQAYRGAYNVRNLVHVLMDIACLYVPYFVFMGVFLQRAEPMLPLILLLVFVPVLASHFLRSRYYTRLDDRTVMLRRKEEHYKECLTARAFFKETRALGAGTFFLSRYIQAFKNAQELRYRTEIKSQGIAIAANGLTLAGYTAILAVLVSLLIQGRISIGSFSAILAATLEMFAMMTEVLDNRLGELSAGLGQIRKYFRFLDLPEQEYGEVHIDDQKDIVFEGVSFTYPGAERSALAGISLRIAAGETLAIVGENGSGKTTLAKLILGLYRLNQGRIVVGDVPLRELASGSAYKNASCVFQDFQRYQLSLRDNVAISDLAKLSASSDAEIQDALAAAGFRADDQQMAQGLDTLISKEFGGTDLSRGEWQRLSIARAYYRSHQLIVLDEPTAAIDPFEEDRIYRDFMELKRNHTAVIITHRLGAVRLADRVLVLREGRIAGIGTHERLLDESPYYRRLWTAQSRYLQ
ncbi:MAG TPA: ABC transporter ATP-binding protein [Bacillota bacterium]|jgi:ATP-binding cassette subfamily B protein|nr:ABC transporter ATP-binding protein [Bacillota bacterium]HOI38213.1 ABC transporter ATP-binding protein [Bacillota bacterium]